MVDSDNLVTLDFSLQHFLQSENLSLGHVEEIGVLLTGCSVLDWHRLDLGTVPAVNEFLLVNGYNPNDIADRDRLTGLHARTLTYLKEEFGVSLPKTLVEPSRIQNLFLVASGKSPIQPQACSLLKVLHVLNHLDARQLFIRLPVSERSLFGEVETRVRETVDHMRSIGFHIEHFRCSHKTRGATVTKVLSKEAATAAQVYDRLRFRIVSREVSDIVPIVYFLKKRLVPFNYIIPEESRNNLLAARTLLPRLGMRDDLQVPLGEERYKLFNEFTHPQFRVISFVADIPHRVDRLLENIDQPALLEFGKIVFIPVEFQIFDLQTWEENERGPANHEAYKARQRAEVWRRLMGSDPDEEDPTGSARPTPYASRGSDHSE